MKVNRHIISITNFCTQTVTFIDMAKLNYWRQYREYLRFSMALTSSGGHDLLLIPSGRLFPKRELLPLPS